MSKYAKFYSRNFELFIGATYLIYSNFLYSSYLALGFVKDKHSVFPAFILESQGQF